MTVIPRALLLNGTCLDVLDSHREWLRQTGIELIADPAFQNLAATGLEPLLPTIDAIIVPAAAPVTSEVMRRLPRLQCISIAASGFDCVDVEAATAAGIVVTNAPVREGAEVVADMTWGLLLAVSRQIPLHDRKMRAGDHQRGMGHSPWRKTLGIVGLGQIGRAVARRAIGFEMSIVAAEPFPNLEFIDQYSMRIVNLQELLSISDFVTLHVRLDHSTRCMIGESEFAQMKSSAYLINAARKELVDERALIQALRRRRIAGAALDDPPSHPRSELLAMENVVFTPHLGNRAMDGVNAVFRCAVTNVADVTLGRPCEYVLNPEALSRAKPPRDLTGRAHWSP